MIPTLSVRRAALSDIDQLIELRKELLSFNDGYYASRNESEERAWQQSYRLWLTNNINNEADYFIAVAELNKQVCACSIAIIDNRVPMRGCLNGKSGWIQTVVVAKAFRRQGIALQLMEYLLQWFKSKAVQQIVLQTTPMAASLYEQLGFTPTTEALLLKTLE